MLEDVTKPKFIREDEEFREIIQYLIITGFFFIFHVNKTCPIDTNY